MPSAPSECSGGAFLFLVLQAWLAPSSPPDSSAPLVERKRKSEIPRLIRLPCRSLPALRLRPSELPLPPPALCADSGSALFPFRPCAPGRGQQFHDPPHALSLGPASFLLHHPRPFLRPFGSPPPISARPSPPALHPRYFPRPPLCAFSALSFPCCARPVPPLRRFATGLSRILLLWKNLKNMKVNTRHTSSYLYMCMM